MPEGGPDVPTSALPWPPFQIPRAGCPHASHPKGTLLGGNVHVAVLRRGDRRVEGPPPPVPSPPTGSGLCLSLTG